MCRATPSCPCSRDELARAQKAGRTDLPASMAEVTTLLDEVRQARRGAGGGHAAARHRGFCVPVFDSGWPHGAGIVTLPGSVAFRRSLGQRSARPAGPGGSTVSGPGVCRLGLAHGVPWRPLAASLTVLAAHLLVLQVWPGAFSLVSPCTADRQIQFILFVETLLRRRHQSPLTYSSRIECFVNSRVRASFTG